MPPDELAARRFIFFMLVTSAALVGVVVYPLASALFLAAVLAGVMWPLHERLAKKLKNRRNLSAGIFIAVILIVIVGPLGLLSGYLIKEVSQGIEFVSTTLKSEDVSGLLEPLPPALRDWGQSLIDRLPRDPKEIGQLIEKHVSEQGGQAAAAVGAAVAATGSFLFQAAMMMIALFFLLVDGKELVAWLDKISPLPKGQTKQLLTEIKKVSSSVVISTVLTAAVQAVAALIGYFIARVPSAIFFGVVTFVFAMIPAIGAGSVCLAAAGLLLVTGHPYGALFLAIWAVTVVALVDNVVKPLLIKDDVEMHGAVVFFALLGGLAVFGPIGLVLGPIVVAMLLAFLRMYTRTYHGTGSVRPPPESRPAPQMNQGG